MNELDADDLTLPIKRTDGETIEDRLTGNAYHNILPARYLRKDADGELIEGQEELFERVAKNIALAEAVYEADRQDVEVTVRPEQIKPDHPRRDELAAEVFGAGTTVDDDRETRLTEHNVNKFAYETVVPELPDGVREHVESTAAEFRELMEDLSFMPNCVPPDSMVAAEGGLKQLTDIEPGERVYDDRDGQARVDSKFENGEKLVREIETASGYTVRATPEHYFRVISERGEYEWRQVKDLQPDDVIALQTGFLDDDGAPASLLPPTAADGGTAVAETTDLGRPREAIDVPDSMTPALAEWLGLYIGDGTARESGVRVAFDDQDEDLVEYWCELTESVFGFEPTTRHRNDAACVIGQAGRRDLYDFLGRNDLLKDTSKTATVPEAVLESGRTCVARFLRGLFEADGTVGERAIELYTHSEALADQAQKLLLGLGIRSVVSDKRDGHRVTIRKNECGKQFVEQVGFSSDRKRVDAKRFETVADNATSVKIPNQTERLHEWFQQSDLGHDAYRDLSQFLIDPDSEYHQEISVGMFRRYAEQYPELWDSPVAEFVEQEQFYERVSSVDDVGRMAVEDMQVPRRNTYVVEGFVSHNSPTLMNAGDELQQLSACFVDSPADDIDDIHQTAKEAANVFQCLTARTTVHVEGKGIVSIAEVEPGDEIRQREGDGHRTRTVEETHAYDDAPVHRVETDAGIELVGTPNHELLVDGEWTRIDHIGAGDTLSIRLGWLPDADETDPLETVPEGGQWASNRNVSNELELVPNGTGGRTRGDVSFDAGEFERLYDEGHTDGEIAAELGVSAASVGQHRATRSLEPNGDPVKSVVQPTTLTPDLAELLGMWIGDGSKHADGIRFHLNREENLEHADRLCRRLFDEGLDWRYEDGCYDAVLHSHEIKRFWLANFGSDKPDAPSASVPDAVRAGDHDTVAAFLRGLFSTDGSLQNGRYPRLWSASEDLIAGVQQLLLGLGIPATTWELDSEDRDYFNVGPTGEAGLTEFAERVGFLDARDDEMVAALEDTDFRGTTVGTIRDDGTWDVPVSAVEPAGTDVVYDVTVAGNHEYVADSVVSHNSGGGMGYAFWRLRPYGDPVGSTGGIASGPITFMRTYDQMCFPAGTRVLTPGGQRPIEELDAGDFVIDENGDRQPVVETMERHVEEDLVEVTPKRLNRPIRATGEHPFRVARDDGFEWVDAADLRPGDRLVLGHATGEDELSMDETLDLTSIASGPLVFTDGGVRVNREYYSATKGTSPQSFASEVPMRDFATIAGWYLAEGCVVYRRGMPSEVTFTLHSDERDAAAEIRDALEAFDVPSRLDPVEDRNTLHVHAEHSSFAQFAEELFGTGASQKRVPDVLWNATPEVQARTLEALFDGDGRLEKRGKSQRAKLKLTSESVIDFAFQVGLRCGVQFSRHDRTPDDRQPTYEVSVSVSTALDTPLERLFDDVDEEFSARDRTKQAHGREVVTVDTVERIPYEGPVYNAEVADTHTYVAEDLVVHNCETIAQGGARRGAQMGVMRVSHPDVVQFIHAKNKDVSLAHTLRLNDPDDFTHTSFAEALEEARDLIDDEGRVPEHLRNAVEGHLSNFNISVGITDEFMDAVEAGEEFTFTNPRTGEAHVATPQTKELYEMFDLGEHVEVGEVLSVPAELIWERIVEGAHENGEPGVIYLERVNKEHSFDVEEHPDHRILATNPSLAAGTKVLTDQGIVEIENLEGRRVEVPTVSGEWATAVCHRSGNDETLYEVELSNGKSYLATEEHKWPVLQDGSYERTPTTALEGGQRLPIAHRTSLRYGSIGDRDEGFLVGWLYGDGSVTNRKDGRTQYGFTFSQEDARSGPMDRVLDTLEDITGVEYSPTERQRDGEPWYEVHASHAALRTKMKEYGVGQKTAGVPDLVWNDASESFRKGFVDGLFSADGYVDPDENRIVFVSSRENLVKDVSDLLGFYGLKTSLRGSEVEKWGDSYDRWDLKLSRTQAHRFRETFELTHEQKAASLADLKTPDRGNILSDNVTVEAVRPADETGPVWDLRVDEKTHTFALSHAFTGNCGEQPLEEYEACNLGHINLSTLAAEGAPDWRVWADRHGREYDSRADAIEAFLDESIDWEAFDRRIEMGTRFLENVVTMSDFPVPEIEQKVREMRKIGLGIMGLAQLYVQLGVKYGSDAGNEIARQLMRHINHHSKWTSHELADERGTFAEWEHSKYDDPVAYREWFEHQTGLDADDWEGGFPIRNHNTTTIAPTGCVEENSLISTDEGLQPIRNLDETTAEFEQWDEIEVGVSTDGGTKTATAIYDNGFADVRRIETEGGFSVTATPNHRFRTLTDDGEYAWREAGDFEPGDRIVLQRNTFDGGSSVSLDTSERDNYYRNTDENLELPGEMTPALAEFLGYFMGDGYVHDDVGVKLVVESDAEELDSHLRELGETLFGVAPTVEDRGTRHVLAFGGRHLPRYFDDNGWKKDDGNEGEGAASAFVPEEVLRSEEETAKAFLRGLFEADGTASRKVELSTVSRTLADQVQSLLLSLGCVFVRDELEMESRGDHYGDRPRHTVRGANKREDKRFVDEVGFITKSTGISLTAQSYKNDTYPPAIVETLRAVEGYDSVSRSVRKRVNQSPINGSVSRKLVEDVESETGETVRLDGRQVTDFYAATVESVTTDKAYTKDISVPSNNTYVANGFVTHNTTSMVGNTTGGCEPIYNVAYYKNVSDDVQGDEMLVEFDDYFLRVLEDNDIDVEAVKQEAQEQMAENEFAGVEGLSTVPDAIGELFVTTGDLSAKQHASVQTACQDGVDSAISKTVNAPNDSTVADAKEVFEYIYDHGGKGVTYYRDGTRSKQVLTTRAQNTEFADMDPEEVIAQVEDVFDGIEGFLDHEAVQSALDASVSELLGGTDADDGPEEFAQKQPRPDVLHGVTQRIDTGYGKLYVNINEDPEADRPFELFANIGNSGGFTASFTEALAKTISTALRAGVDPYEIADELQGIRSPKVAWDKGEQIQSIPDAIGTAMRRYLDGDVERAYPQQQTLEETAEDSVGGQQERDPEPEPDPEAKAGVVSEPEPDGGVASETTEGQAQARAEEKDAQQTAIDAGESPECPECGSLSLYYSEGCKTCESCGWSEC